MLPISQEPAALQDVRAANVKALTDGALLALHRDDFNAMLGSLTHIRHMWRFEALRKVCKSTLLLCAPWTVVRPLLTSSIWT